MDGITLADFEGRWTIARQIEDALAGQTLTFEGEAVFQPGDDGLLYTERGVLRAPGQPPMQAERRYLWRAEPDGIAVDFADGRYFHRIGPGDRPVDTHDCPPDLYRVSYDFGPWPDWHAVWRVSGPRKNYVMDSLYRRL